MGYVILVQTLAFVTDPAFGRGLLALAFGSSVVGKLEMRVCIGTRLVDNWAAYWRYFL